MKLENETRNTIYYYTDYSGLFSGLTDKAGSAVLLTQIFPTDHLVDKTIRGIEISLAISGFESCTRSLYY